MTEFGLTPFVTVFHSYELDVKGKQVMQVLDVHSFGEPHGYGDEQL